MDNYGGGPSQAGVVYQGYPYVNPVVLDVPSVSAEDAARWTNLPRAVQTSAVKGGGDDGKGQRNETSTSTLRPAPGLPKLDPDENPVVYIDLPESSGSDVADRIRVENDQAFVQDTIFYDPFKDRRITPGSSGASSSRSSPAPRERPNPPSSLNVGSSDRGFPGSSRSPVLPSMMSKEADVYGQFNVSEGYQREPPPAYTEIDSSPSVAPTPQTETPATSPSEPQAESTPEPPRTQVIIPTDGLDSSKFIQCKGCGFESNCVYVRKTGFGTHAFAVLFVLIGLFPLLLVVYYTDLFKYKIYYCRYCSKMVGYEVPCGCKDMVYVE